jgi:hypothetical protein
MADAAGRSGVDRGPGTGSEERIAADAMPIEETADSLGTEDNPCSTR